MPNNKERILYRIYNPVTGLYSNCQDPVSFNNLGKIWFSVSSLKQYLISLGDANIKRLYSDCCISLSVIRPCDVNPNTVSFKDILSA